MTSEPLADDLAPDQPAAEVPPKTRLRRRPGFWIAFVLAAALVAGWGLAFYYQHSSETYRQADAKSRVTASDLSKRLESMTQERDTEKARADQLQTREDAVKQREDRVQTREDEVKKREDAVSQAEKVQAQNTIHEGNWAVGVDIQPGTYRTKEPISGSCYWEIDSDPNGNNIVANDNVTGGRPTVTLSRGQYFTTQRCGDWAKVS